MYLAVKALHGHTIISYQKRHARGYFIMQLRRERALGDRKFRMYLSHKRITAYQEHEAAVTTQKIARGFLVRLQTYRTSEKYIIF